MAESEPQRVLIVEGENDFHVVRQLRRRHSTIPEFSIQIAGNVAKVLEAIGPTLLVSDRRAVGILIDADDDPCGRWNELTDRLSEEGIGTPPRADPDGAIIEPDGYPRIGVWMMPDN